MGVWNIIVDISGCSMRVIEKMWRLRILCRINCSVRLQAD